ncbi:MAG: tRNA uridine-5-carboxymethylaminomethyl(34) synthesis GTPase MnmE [Vicingaceae bacterium]
MSNHINDTIVALATPQGVGAIGVLRVSGEKAIQVANQIFNGKDLNKVPSHTIHFGTIKDGEKIIDEVLVSVFKAPNSFTGENAVEISTHGSPYILQEIIKLIVKKGARLAEPGEFTKRAFLNKKLDLSQAEAVADLINAENEAAHQLAIHQMRGGFSKDIEKLRQQLIHFASLIELELDFGEEDVEFADRSELQSLVTELKNKIEQLIQSFNYGNVIKTGIPVAIVGEPNVGKSTLLNALLNENRAIVTDIPGTTRDTIEDYLFLDGFKFRFIDTAGIRKTSDIVESIGIDKTYESISKAKIILLLFDVSNTSIDEIDKHVEAIKRKSNKDAQIILVGNKIDKASKQQIDKLKSNYNNLVLIAASINQNVEELKNELTKLVKNKQSVNQTIVTNIRHYEALQNVNESLNKVLEGLEIGITGDFIAMDIRQALHFLGLITGSITTDDLLGNIFANFCIGK